MTRFKRWLRFNAVGLLGVAVQLTTLALLHRLWPTRLLLCTALAIEITLLHNFTLHVLYTWRERDLSSAPAAIRRGRCWPAPLLRFHLSNGLVSMFGNLLLMRVLVSSAHLPLLAANAIAILSCSLLNFWLSDTWTFARTRREVPRRLDSRLRNCSASVVFACAFVLLSAAEAVSARAQTAGFTPLRARETQATDCAYENVFGGPVVTRFNGSSVASAMAGVTFGQYFATSSGLRLAASPQFELGVIGPLPGGHPADGMVSVNAMFSRNVPRWRAFPSATAGYTRFFATGNAFNIGLGFDFGGRPYQRMFRLEFRDYFLYDGPQQQVRVLRLALGKLIAD